MKRGNSGVKFRDLGSSPAKQKEEKPQEKYTPHPAGSQGEKAQHTREASSEGRAFDKGLFEVIQSRGSEMYGKPDKNPKSAKQAETGSEKQMRQITKRNTAKSKSKSSWDIKGYLKGEQGYVPDYKGESTKKTVNKVARKVVKATDDTTPQIKPMSATQGAKKTLKTVYLHKDSVSKEGFSEGAQQIGDNFGRMALKQSMKKVKKPAEKKYMKVKRDLKMKPPYKRPVGPRAEVKPTKKTVPGDVKLDPGYEDPIKIQKVQREGLVPGSQGFNKKAKVNVAKKKGEELLDYTKSK